MHILHLFNPREVLLAKHAQHVVFIHFPIALFLVGVVFDVIAQWNHDGKSEKPWDGLPLPASEDRLPSDQRERHINKRRRASRQALAFVAYCNLAVAALTTPVVIATGLLAWQLQLEGRKLTGILRLHLVLGILAGALICVTWYIHYRARRAPGRPLPTYRLPIELLTAILIVATAHLGGFLTGANIPSA